MVLRFLSIAINLHVGFKPNVSSRIYREVPLTSTRSGLRESPVMMLGDRNKGRSAYNEHVGNDDKVFAR